MKRNNLDAIPNEKIGDAVEETRGGNPRRKPLENV